MRFVDGVDVEALLDIAMGVSTLPSNVGAIAAPMPVAPSPASVVPSMQYGAPPAAPVAAIPSTPAVLDIANAALEAAFGGDNNTNQQPPPPPSIPAKTRILVLHNMVVDEDLETDEDYNGLMEEVKEECEKFGTLVSMKIPRAQDGYAPTALKKIFLEYATVEEGINAERELAGRQFGPAVVTVSHFNEADYAGGKLS